MLISFRHEFIFIHNYKVAGTSIKAALSEYGLINPLLNNSDWNRAIDQSQLRVLYTNKYFRRVIRKLTPGNIRNFKSHLHAKQIKSYLPDDIYSKYYKFGFVRNPWDWQVSLYHYMSQLSGHHQNDIAKGFSSFEEYLEWRIQKDKRTQKDFFYDDNNNLIVNFVGKFENIVSDFDHICNQVGLDAKLGHKNSSKRNNNYRKYYSTATKNLVADHFEEDIKLFDYEF
jgi:hypothetical protein